MAKKRDERVAEAERMFKQGMQMVEIASQLGVSDATVRCWKHRYGWIKEDNATLQTKQCNVAKKKKRGAPYGNHRATGPPGNKNAEKHGFYSKFLPAETMDILKEISNKDPIDILWDNIQLSYAGILRAQQLMYVKDQGDKTVEKIGESSGETYSEKWEVQQAWDKQATFLGAQARAMQTLNALIKQYDNMLKSNWELATEEQKARLEVLRLQQEKLKMETQSDEYDDGVVIINDV